MLFRSHKVTYTVGSSTGNTAADVVISSSSSSLVTVANEYKAFITVSGTRFGMTIIIRMARELRILKSVL